MILFTLILRFVLFCLNILGGHSLLIQLLESELEKHHSYILELNQNIEILIQ